MAKILIYQHKTLCIVELIQHLKKIKRYHATAWHVISTLPPQTSEGSGATGVPVSQRSCWTVVSFWMKVLLFVIFTPAFLNYASLQREGQVLSAAGETSSSLQEDLRIMYSLVIFSSFVLIFLSICRCSANWYRPRPKDPSVVQRTRAACW